MRPEASYNEIMRGRRISSTVLIGVALLGTVVAAQQFGRGRGVRARLATAQDFDGRFNFCRLMYTSVVREEGGMGWGTDYPGADQNLSVRLSELTKTAVSRGADGEPNHVVVRATDPLLFQCPWVQMSDAGTAGFTDEEEAGRVAYTWGQVMVRLKVYAESGKPDPVFS